MIPFLVRLFDQPTAHHKRNQPKIVRPELAPLALPMVVEGLIHRFSLAELPLT
jgi:hypothetical protein